MTQQTDWLRGCATALVTPFKSDGSVDEKCLRDLVEYQIAGVFNYWCHAAPPAKARR